MRLVATLVIASFLLAGCFGSDSEPESDAPSEPANVNEAPTTPAPAVNDTVPETSEGATAVQQESGAWTIWRNDTTGGYPLVALPSGDPESQTAFMYDLLESKPENITDVLIEIAWQDDAMGEFSLGAIVYGQEGDDTDLVVTQTSSRGTAYAESTTLRDGILVLSFDESIWDDVALSLAIVGAWDTGPGIATNISFQIAMSFAPDGDIPDDFTAFLL